MAKPYDGPEVVHGNRNIRKMLSLAQATSSDVFYDLGCGRGQLCIIAASEFRVKRAVGIERRKDRAKKANELAKSFGLSRKIDIRNEDYQDSDFDDATIVYNGLMEEKDDLDFYSERLPAKCKVITLQLPLVGVLPTSQDYPFYLMRKPFKKTRDSRRWISTVLSKMASMDEFVKELTDDPDYRTDLRGLKSLMKMRFNR